MGADSSRLSSVDARFTVDIGGDKALPYLLDAKEEAENPSMGWRALRLSLDRSTLMKAQARALVQAAAGKVLRVMFPMVSEPWEYEQARALFEEQVAWAERGLRLTDGGNKVVVRGYIGAPMFGRSQTWVRQ